MKEESQAKIRRAKEVPILDVWKRLGLPDVPEGRAVCSPFREDKNPSLQVGGRKNIVFDHAENSSLDTIALARKVKDCSFPEALDFILGENGASAPHKAQSSGRKESRPMSRKARTGQAKEKRWPSLESAEEEFAALPMAGKDSDAIALLAGDYGIPSKSIPESWRVFVHKGRKGIVYQGFGPDGMPCAYKYRGLERGKDRKRFVFFLAGAGGALVFRDKEERPLVVVSGEEKALAASVAEFNALGPLTGEKALGPEWIQSLCKNPCPVILSNDNDETGQKANMKTGQALEAAGFPVEKIRQVSWPDGTPEKADLNDILKDSGPDGLRTLLESARPWNDESGDRLLSIDELFAIQLDERDIILNGGMFCAGELGVIIGPPDVGKTRLCEQLIFEALFGREMWLETLPIHRRDLRILLLQTENSVRRLTHDFKRYLRGCAPEKRQAVQERFRFTEAGLEPDLKRIEVDCRRFAPDLVVFDPLADFLLSLNDENSAPQMRKAVRDIQRAVRAGSPKAAVLAVHHAKMGRSATAGAFDWDAGAFGRGSKALVSMARCQINFAPGNPEGSVVVVICGKSNNVRKFKPFAVRLEENGWYKPVSDFSISGWKKEVSSRNLQAIRAQEVSKLLKPGELLTRNDLKIRIEDKLSVQKSKAYKLIEEATEQDIICDTGGKFMLSKDARDG